jgi:hypothetical protein
VDDSGDNCVLCVEPLGMEDRCALKPDCCTADWLGCAQGCAHRRAVAGVTGAREVFWKKVRLELGWRSALGPLADASGEFFNVIEHLTSLGHLRQDLPLGVHDGGVVTAECLADLG